MTNMENSVIEMTYYNSTDTCDKIKEDGNICGKSFYGKAFKEYDKSGKFTGKWVCHSCYNKERYHIKKDTNANLRNSVRNHRTGNLDSNTESAKGDLFQKLTCEWLGIEDLNAKNDNYNWPIDHSRYRELGIVQTKGSFYDDFNKSWHGNLTGEQNKEFDHLIFYCGSKDHRHIEIIYILPWEEVLRRQSISIIRSYIYGWYEKYRIKDREKLKKINDIWGQILTVRR